MRRITIGIVTQSPVIMAGLSAILSECKDLDTVSFGGDIDTLSAYIDQYRMVALIVDPASASDFSPAQIPEYLRTRIAVIALCFHHMPKDMARTYDAVLSVYDTPDIIIGTVRKLTDADASDDKLTELSSREKDVIIGIVKGMSNKEIADHLHVSVNTVMTHRRNISSKLQIHSPAGLTIYAIVSKLVNIDDITVS